MTPEEWQRVRPILESALELDSARRTAYLDGVCADPSLRLEVESLIAVHEQAGTNLLTGAVGPGFAFHEEAHFRLLPGKRIGPYEIIEEIAQGGMGAVYRAIRADGQYKQQVALKIVRADLGVELTANRFRNERQILASLDHPNIAKIMDGGTTADGLPYFVMELIDGLPVTEYCDQNKLPIDARLNIFRTVCSAVHYAHQHLVIHRDLKPGNILITSEGVPKLLDFGIAKILDPNLLPENLSLTAVGLWMMTPEYASPEQLRGQPITTATDIYSLGLVLYELLAGRRAFCFPSHMPHDIARAVLETDPEKPSTAIRRAQVSAEGNELKSPDAAGLSAVREGSLEKLSKRLSGDLDNIVLMALRKEPQHRYTSVEQFAEDIRRHLEHLPVMARRDTLGYRTSKFVIRHKGGVAATAVVAIMLLAGLTVTLREAQIARAERARAERRFNDVRNLANSLIFDVHDSIQDLPGSTPARKLIVEKAVRYLDSLAQESRGDISLQRELAAAYKRIGDVQGDPFHANLGDTAGALDSFHKRLAIRQAIAKLRPDDLDDQIALAASYREMCNLQAAYFGDLGAAMGNCHKALVIADALNKTHSGNKKVIEELANALEILGNVQAGNGTQGNMGDVYAGLESDRKALALVKQLADASPADLALQRWLGILNARTADALVQTGDRSGALLRYQETSKIFQRLAKNTNNTELQRLLALTYSRIGDVLLMDGQFGASRQYYQKELQTNQPMATADPADVKSRMLMAGTHANIGHALWRAGRLQEGLASLRRGLNEISEINKSHQNSEVRSVLGLIHIWIGGALERRGELDAALSSYSQAQSIYEGMSDADPQDVQEHLMLSGTQNRIAGTYKKQGNLSIARSHYEKALAISEPLASLSPPNLDALYNVFESYSGLGDISALFAKKRDTIDARNKSWNLARSWYQKSLAVSKRIPNHTIISPNGFESRNPQEVAQRLAQCEAALPALPAANLN